MKGRWKKFLSYYTNYKVLFFKDMFCAMISAAITLVYPMLTRYITGTILNQPKIDYSKIYLLGLFMLCLIVVEYFCNYFIGYLGHVMGVYMEKIYVMSYLVIIKNYLFAFMMNKTQDN